MRALLTKRRCICARCGSHVIAMSGQATLGGRCSTCGSYEFAPLARAARAQP